MEMTAISHVAIDGQGVAWIDETNVKVVEVVLDQIAYGWSPEEIHFQHPHLSLAQVYSALAFYYDHQDELDTEIAERLAEIRNLRDKMPESQGRRKLREIGKRV